MSSNTLMRLPPSRPQLDTKLLGGSCLTHVGTQGAHSGINGRASIMVTSKTSGQKIMVERAMYWNSRGAGTDTIGGFGD